jgi:putative ubiquitin-RnfH superfamily antitoxin RatB of RatAB toxin-antitoxin module
MSAEMIAIAIAWVDAAGQHERRTHVALGTTLGQFLGADMSALGIPPQLSSTAAGVGVWGRVRAKSYVLREADRVEFYAPLKADPKEQRRRRVR